MSGLDFLVLRKRLREFGYELVHRGKTVYIRRRPRTRDEPTPKMQAARGAMKLASKTGEGSQGFSEDGLPIIAARNRVQIPAAMHFLKVAPTERARIAQEIADECELTNDEKEMLVQLVTK